MSFAGLERRAPIRLGLWQRLRLRVFGDVKVGRLDTERGHLDMYLFRCGEHGYQVNYPSGHHMDLHCRECVKEENKK